MRDLWPDFGSLFLPVVLASPLGLLMLWGTLRLEEHLQSVLSPDAFVEDLAFNLQMMAVTLPFVPLIVLALVGVAWLLERRQEDVP